MFSLTAHYTTHPFAKKDMHGNGPGLSIFQGQNWALLFPADSGQVAKDFFIFSMSNLAGITFFSRGLHKLKFPGQVSKIKAEPGSDPFHIETIYLQSPCRPVNLPFPNPYQSWHFIY